MTLVFWNTELNQIEKGKFHVDKKGQVFQRTPKKGDVPSKKIERKDVVPLQWAGKDENGVDLYENFVVYYFDSETIEQKIEVVKYDKEKAGYTPLCNPGVANTRKVGTTFDPSAILPTLLSLGIKNAEKLELIK